MTRNSSNGREREREREPNRPDTNKGSGVTNAPRAESGPSVVLEKAKAHKWLAELPAEAEEMRRTFAVTEKDVV